MTTTGKTIGWGVAVMLFLAGLGMLVVLYVLYIFLAFMVMTATNAHAAGAYSDTPTSEWFKSLNIRVPGSREVVSCCDQSDCKPTQADWRGDAWWAESRIFPGEWVTIPANRVLTEPNPLMNAVICEAVGGRTEFGVRTVPSGKVDYLYCFEPPPQGY